MSSLNAWRLSIPSVSLLLWKLCNAKTTRHRASTEHTLTLCCHSNASRAPIANPPNSAQLGGIPYQSPKLHPGPCKSRAATDTQTDTHATTIHFASSTTHAKCNKQKFNILYITRMWADVQRDGRPADYRWRPLRKFRNSISCTTPQSLADGCCTSAVQ